MSGRITKTGTLRTQSNDSSLCNAVIAVTHYLLKPHRKLVYSPDLYSVCISAQMLRRMHNWQGVAYIDTACDTKAHQGNLGAVQWAGEALFE